MGIVVVPPHSNLRLILIWTAMQNLALDAGEAIAIEWPREFYSR